MRSQDTRFRLGNNAERFEHHAPLTAAVDVEEDLNRRINRLNWRLVFLGLLMPLVVGGMIFFVYQDHQRNQTWLRDREQETTAAINEMVEKRFSALSEKQGKLAQEIETATLALHESTGWLEKKIAEMQASVEKKLKEKINQMDLNETVEAQKSELAGVAEAVKKQLEALLAEVETAKTDLKNEFDTLNTKFYTTVEDVIKIQDELPGIKKDLQAALTKAENIATTASQNSQQIKTLQEGQKNQPDIDTVEKMVGVVNQANNKQVRTLRGKFQNAENSIGQLKKNITRFEKDMIQLEVKVSRLSRAMESLPAVERGGISEKPL